MDGVGGGEAFAEGVERLVDITQFADEVLPIALVKPWRKDGVEE